MKVSDMTLDTVKGYLRVDNTEDDVLLNAILSASKQYAKSYTGLNDEELEEYEDIPLAVLTVCADMYDLRQFTMNGIQVNPTAIQILGSHSKNLL